MKPQYIKIDEKGSKFWYSDKKQNKLHREDGPAVELADGSKLWYLNDKYHRKDGPAIDNASYEAWYINGNLHREDGPALIYKDGGSYWWYINGKLHREDGPALIYKNGWSYWYVNGKKVTQKVHARLTKKVPTININGKDFTLEELNSLIKTAEGN